MRVITRALAGLCGVLLLVDAYLHSTGTGAVRDALSGTEVPAFFVQALPTIWLFFSWHLVVVAIPLLWAAVSNPPWFLQASIFCGVVALVDFFWVYSVAGWFPGTVVLLLVVAGLVGTSLMLVREHGGAAA